MAKKQGWFNHRKEHALAAMGISTKNNELNKRNPQRITPVQNPQVQRQREQNPRKQNERAQNKRPTPQPNIRPKPDQMPQQDEKPIYGMGPTNWLLRKTGKKEIGVGRGMNDKTRLNIGWKETTGVPQFDDSITQPNNPSRNYDFELQIMPIDNYTRRIYHILKVKGSAHPANDYQKMLSPDSAKEIHEKIEKGEPLNAPFLEYDEKGRAVPYISDVNMAYALATAGETEIPVWIMRRRSEEEKITALYGEDSEELLEYKQIMAYTKKEKNTPIPEVDYDKKKKKKNKKVKK